MALPKGMVMTRIYSIEIGEGSDESVIVRFRKGRKEGKTVYHYETHEFTYDREASRSYTVLGLARKAKEIYDP